MAAPNIRKWFRIEGQFYYNLRFRLHPKVIAGVLEQQEKVPPWEHLPILESPNHAGKHAVTIITNPTCPPCQQTHDLLKRMQATGIDIQVRYIFLLKENIVQASEQEIRNHLKSLIPDIERYVSFAIERRPVPASHTASSEPVVLSLKELPLTVEEDNIDLKQIVQEHRVWCIEHHVNATPTIFINDRVMPTTFSLQDLKYFFKYH